MVNPLTRIPERLWCWQVLPVNYNVAGGDPGMLLQEALARHHVEKNPADFEAHDNLAAMLEARNRLEAAIREYHLAVKLRPHDAAGNNGLGAALVAAGHPEQGVPYLQSALETRPDYFEAHYNLGFALAGQEDFEGAAEQFRLASQLQPEDANVEANLGAALAQTGRYREAKSHFERALQIEPNQPKSRSPAERNELAREQLPRPCSAFRPRAFRQRFVIPSVARNSLFAGAGRQQVARRFSPRNAKALSISIFYDPML
jgi:tetratricopeptide (TPR) repeat protein